LDANCGNCFNCKNEITHSYYSCEPCSRRLCGGCDSNHNNHAYTTFIQRAMGNR
jgi:hypothetical protein